MSVPQALVTPRGKPARQFYLYLLFTDKLEMPEHFYIHSLDLRQWFDFLHYFQFHLILYLEGKNP